MSSYQRIPVDDYDGGENEPENELINSPETWICESCTYVNPNTENTCKICQTPYIETSTTAATTTTIENNNSTNVEASYRPRWTCPQCTYHNTATTNECELCHHRKQAIFVQPSSPPPPTAATTAPPLATTTVPPPPPSWQTQAPQRQAMAMGEGLRRPDFQKDFFDFGDDIEFCLLGCFCPCCAVGENAQNRDGPDSKHMFVSVGLCALSVVCSLPIWLPYAIYQRHVTRMKLNIEPNIGCDILAYCCFPCCAVVQEKHEIRSFLQNRPIQLQQVMPQQLLPPPPYAPQQQQQ